jgi:hypothetical protein
LFLWIFLSSTNSSSFTLLKPLKTSLHKIPWIAKPLIPLLRSLDLELVSINRLLGVRRGHPSASLFLGVLLKSLDILVIRLGVVAALVFQRCQGKRGVYVRRVYFQGGGKIPNTSRNFAELLHGTSSRVETARVPRVDFEKPVAVTDSLLVALFLHVGRSSDKKRFFVGAVMA